MTEKVRSGQQSRENRESDRESKPYDLWTTEEKIGRCLALVQDIAPALPPLDGRILELELTLDDLLENDSGTLR